MATAAKWITEVYAVMIVCLKEILSDATDIPITNDLLSIFSYSFICFRHIDFNTTLERTMNMTRAYIEFYKMSKNTQHGTRIFKDVYLFIVKTFPACQSLLICQKNVVDMPLFTSMASKVLQIIQNDTQTYKDHIDTIAELATDVYTQYTPVTEVVNG